jgi:UDP-galactopyranose mutase
MDSQSAAGDLICLSQLRWDLVFQRPNHLMSRCARTRRVYFFEQPLLYAGPAELEITKTEHGPIRVVPKLPLGMDEAEQQRHLEQMMDTLVTGCGIKRYSLWYDTPMALAFTRHLKPELVVYDVMHELKTLASAPRELLDLEAELMRRADVVFTGGQSLYQAKKNQHPNVQPFPSSVDVGHFRRARLHPNDPLDQAPFPHPRLGYLGVVDDRLDFNLIDALCDLEPSWQLIMLGPVAKMDPARLPQKANLHWLGGKPYAQLPDYLSGWDVGLMPFVLNDATRFLSPLKTPELLAAGRPVVATPLADVVSPYGELNLLKLATDAAGFAAAVRACLAEDPIARQRRADAFLAAMSWDMTWHRMSTAMDEALERRRAATTHAEAA